MQLKNTLKTYCPTILKPIFAKIESSPVGYRLAKGTFWSVLGAVISRGLALIASILVARILGKTGFGELGMIQSTVGMFGVFAGFGLGITSTKYVAEFRQSDPERAGRIIGLSGIIALCTGGLMAVALFFSAPWLAMNTINAPHLGNILRIGALILLGNALNGAQTGALSGFEAFKTIAYVNFISGLISFPMLIGGAYIGGLNGAVWALVINITFNWLLNHFALRKEMHQNGIHFTYKYSLLELPVLWKFSLPMTLSGIMVGPTMWICNTLLVNKPSGYAQLGLYTAAYQFYMPVLFITSIIANVYLPILSNSFVVNSHSSFRFHAKRMLITNGIGLLIFSSLFLFLFPTLLSAYGKSYDFSFTLLLFVILSATLQAFGGYINSVLVAMRMPWYGFTGNCLWAIFYISLFIYCSRYGATGMAISLTISLFLSQTFIEYFMFKRIFQINKNLFAMVLIKAVNFIKSTVRKNTLKMATTTAFFRNIPQLKTISESIPVPQRIYVFACSTGCEAFTLAMFYHKTKPEISPQIFGFDIDPGCITKAQSGIYSANELLYGKNRVYEEEVRSYLHEYLTKYTDNSFKVLETIKARCNFSRGNILDADFMLSLEKADLVLCQNVLIHLTEDENQKAIKLIANTVRPGGILVIGGMQLHLRAKFSKEMHLTPITNNCKEIHEAQRDLRNAWNINNVLNRPYTALPPFKAKNDWEYLFSTIFQVNSQK